MAKNVPATPREKYEALKGKMVLRDKWNEAEDMKLRKFLGLPLVDEAPKPEPKPKAPKKAAPKKKGAKVKAKSEENGEVSIENTKPELRARAKELEVSTKGSKKQILARIEKAK